MSTLTFFNTDTPLSFSIRQYDIHICSSVSATCSSPAKALQILFRPIASDRIFRFSVDTASNRANRKRVPSPERVSFQQNRIRCAVAAVWPAHNDAPGGEGRREGAGEKEMTRKGEG